MQGIYCCLIAARKPFARGFALKRPGPTARIDVMKTCYAVALAALTGAGIGGPAVQGIHAQGKPPAYHIAEIDVTNEDLYNKDWAPKVDATVKAAGGVYLVRGTNIERIEGPAPKRLLITRWDNIDKLTAWRESDAYMRTLPILDKAVKSVRSYAVEGVN
jgi:uncharacterized protein (DUF1330 family)